MQTGRITKRKTSERSCFLCQKENVECDEQTPCSRCILKGVPQMCYNSNFTTKTSGGHNMQNQVSSPNKPNRTTVSSTPHTASASSNTLNNNPFHMNNNVNQTNNSNNVQNGTNTTTMGFNGYNNTVNNNNNINNGTDTDMFKFRGTGDLIKHPLNNNNLLNNNINNNSNINLNNQTMDSQQLTNLLINELRDIKEGQRKIYEEISTLKQKNERLEMINETLLTKLSLLSTNDTPIHHHTSHTAHHNPINNMKSLSTIHGDHAISYPKNIKELVDYYNSTQNIFIVFDLSKNPPTVINASKNFCFLLGYSLNEIIGLPWTQIIHPNLIDNTLNVFNQRSLGGNVEMVQLYKHKNGTVFSTLDSHTFIFDSEGRPICDVVSIRLMSPDIVPKEYFLQSNNNSRYRLTSSSNRNTTIRDIDEGTPPSTPDSINTTHGGQYTTHYNQSAKIEEAPPTPISSLLSENNNSNLTPMISEMTTSTPQTNYVDNQNTSPIFNNITQQQHQNTNLNDQPTAPPQTTPPLTFNDLDIGNWDPNMDIMQFLDNNGANTGMSWALNSQNGLPPFKSPPQTSNTSPSNT